MQSVTYAMPIMVIMSIIVPLLVVILIRRLTKSVELQQPTLQPRYVSSSGSMIPYLLSGFITLGFIFFYFLSMPVAISQRNIQEAQVATPDAGSPKHLRVDDIVYNIDRIRSELGSCENTISLYEKNIEQKLKELESIKSLPGDHIKEINTRQALLTSEGHLLEFQNTKRQELLSRLDQLNQILEQKNLESKMKLELSKAQNIVTTTPENKDYQGVIQPESAEPAAIPAAESSESELMNKVKVTSNRPPEWTWKNENYFTIESSQFPTAKEATDFAYAELRSRIEQELQAKYPQSKVNKVDLSKNELEKNFVLKEHDYVADTDLGKGINASMHKVYLLAEIKKDNLDQIYYKRNNSIVYDRILFIFGSFMVVTVFFGIMSKASFLKAS